MKKLLTIMLGIVVLGISVSSVMATRQETEECVEVLPPSPLSFKVGIFQYQWFENPQGVWKAYVDIDPRGGHQYWVRSDKHEPVYTHECPEPTVEPSATPEATPAPTPGLTQAGAPQGKECKGLTIPVTVVWVNQDRTEFSWTKAEEYVDEYWVNYSVGGNIYSVTTKETNFEFSEPVEWIEVSTMHEGCVGPTSVRSITSLPSGRK